MKTTLTFTQVCRTLDAAGEAYGVLALQNGAQAVVTRYGGRVFGPFLSADTPSLNWINPAFASAEALHAFLASGDWNVGGERLWIAPEIVYNVSDRFAIDATYNLPAAVDPARYTLQPDGAGWALAADMTLPAQGLPGDGSKQIGVTRTLRPAPDPLRGLADYVEMMAGVTYAGYDHTVTLTDGPGDLPAESWVLIQLNPGGQLVIPTTPAVEMLDYFGDVPDSARALHGDHMRVDITGARRFKVGYKAAGLTGRVAYLAPHDAQPYLLVRAYFVNPSAAYVEEPPAQPGVTGQALHVYNDDGRIGGFGEMECSGQAVGGGTGRGLSAETFTLWAYSGPVDKLRGIARALVGVRL
jgi:hypothetical protein